MTSPPNTPVPPLSWRLALGCYAASSAWVVLVVVQTYLTVRPPPGDLPACFARWDGLTYAAICRDGYGDETPERRFTLGFFPGYPLLGRLFTWLPGVSAELALLLASHLCLAAAFVLLAQYVRQRCPDRAEMTAAVLLALGLAPTSFYFRMVLSESLFLLLLIGTCHALQRQVPLTCIALLIGCATAVRSVGVVLVPLFLWHLWQRSAGTGQFLMRAVMLLPLAGWGLAAFLLYLAWAFGDPLAYAGAIYGVGAGKPPEQKFMALLVLEPLWCNFVPSSPCYFGVQDPHQHPALGMFLANPIYFALTVVLVAVGAVKRWLNAEEILLSAGLLAVPYVSRSYEMCMGGFGRYAAVVFPVYLVLGRLWLLLPRWAALALLGLSAGLLALYSAKFALAYPYFY